MTEQAEYGAPYVFDASDGQKFEFPKLEDMIQYAARERDYWVWLYQLPQIRTHQNPLFALTRIFAPLDSALKENQDKAGLPDGVEIAARLADYFAWTPAIHDRAPLRVYLDRVRVRSDNEAMWTLGWLAYRAGLIKGLDSPVLGWNEQGLIAGLASAWQWDGRNTANEAAGISADLAQKAAGDAFVSRDQTASALNAASAAVAEIDAHVSVGDAAVKESADRLKKFSSELEQSLDEVVKTRSAELSARWDELTTTYSETLKLAAPAKYWKTKCGQHVRFAAWFAVSAGVFGVVFGLLLGCLCYWLMGTSSGATLPPWRDLLPSIVAAVVFLWVLRTLMRLTMSHVHLSLDAAEREVMVQCYLAMTKEGETTGDERGALFAAIFRPTGDGIVKDESPPIPLWEMLKATKAGSNP